MPEPRTREVQAEGVNKRLTPRGWAQVPIRTTAARRPGALDVHGKAVAPELGKERVNSSGDVSMKLEDFRQQVRAELAAVDPDGTADPAEIDRLVREVIVFLSTSAEDQVNAAARIAEASPSPRDRELWLRRAERLRQGVVALQVALDELGPAPQDAGQGDL
jgi:hypothetical protein